MLLAAMAGCSSSSLGAANDDLPPRPLTPPSGEVPVPPGFTLSLVTKVDSPTALAFTPDGRMLIGTQPGKLLEWDGRTLRQLLDLSPAACTEIEQGLLGIAVDPAFTSNQSIYVFYTARGPAGCFNRVSRFRLSDAVASAEVTIMDGIPSTNGNHNAGDLNFGPDGYLYVSTGDGGCDYAGGGCDGDNDASRDRHMLLGKVLRVDGNGMAAPDNPFTGPDADRCSSTGGTSPGRVCRETFAEGLRNPYRFAFDPSRPGRFYVNDVGQERWDEINEARAGADYGWSVREGRCVNDSTADCPSPAPGMTDPIFDYSISRRGGCHAISGAAFVPQGVWPEPYAGDYLFGDFGCGAIFRLVREDGDQPRAEPFARGPSDFGVVHLEFGPFRESQALYFTTYAGGGAVYRIAYGS